MSEETIDAPKQGLPRLLWGIIRKPRATLKHLNEHETRTWWAPFLLGLLLVLLPILVAGPIRMRQNRVDFLAAQEQMQEQFGERITSSEADMEQAMNLAASPLTIIAFPAAISLIGRAAGWLIWAGALYLAGMALGGRTTFGQMFRAVVWTWIPYALRGLLQTIYILVSGQIIANPGLSGLVQDSRAAAEEVMFAQPNIGQELLAHLLGQIDIYLFWNLGLLMIGVMVATRLPRRKAVLVVMGVWLLLVAIGLLPTLVGGLLAQQMVGAF